MNGGIEQGIDVLLRKNTYRGVRLGMATNEAALTQSGCASRKALLDAGFAITKLFSPEHGLNVTYADGAMVEDQTDLLTGLPVISLYGEWLKPDPDTLQNLDAVLFDIPDVGARFYTYLWTMTYLMEACAEAGIPFIVLDRPNPAGGAIWQSEGPMLDEIHCSSFIGRWSIPIRHGCTLGELARYFKATRLQNLPLEIIPCEGWERSRSFFETGHPFTPTSPAIRDAETALLYAGTGLLEGINVSEGRGTEFAFKQAGAPWINAVKWKQAMDSAGIKGVIMETVAFTPKWGLFAGEICNGLRLTVNEPGSFRPVAFGICLIQQLMHLYPDKVKPRLYPTVANPSGENHPDRLLGMKDAFIKLKTGKKINTDLNEEWSREIDAFLLY